MDYDGDGFAAEAGDCDDWNAAVYPGALEVCDAYDNDCDGQLNELVEGDGETGDGDSGNGETWYPDADGDGFGDASASPMPCFERSSDVPWDGDCNDGDAAVHPGAAEVCDGWDNDCDGDVDRADRDTDEEVWGDGLDNDCDGHADADFYVFVDGLATIDTGGETPYSSIQAAIEEATDGALIVVGPGTYRERLAIAKAITLRSLEGPDLTVVNGEATGSVVSFGGTTHGVATLDGVTLTEGTGTAKGELRLGGGIYIERDLPVLRNLVIIRNQATSGGGVFFSGQRTTPESVRPWEGLLVAENSSTLDGGGMALKGAGLRLEDVHVRDNTAGGSGGGLYVTESDLELVSVRIRGNTASLGGGFYLSAVTSEVSYSVVMNNAATTGGGVLSEDSSLTLSSSEVLTNEALEDGGGLYARSTSDAGPGSSLVLRYVTLSGNRAVDGAGLYLQGSGGTFTSASVIGNVASGSGGGVLLDHAWPDILNSSFWENYADGSGGGLFVMGGNTTIQGTQFQGNSAGQGGGGAGFCEARSGSLSQSRFLENIANRSGALQPDLEALCVGSHGLTQTGGGGFLLVDTTLEIDGVVAQDNVSYGVGGGILLQGADSSLTHVTLEGNVAARGGGGACLYGSAPRWENVAILGNRSDTVGGGLLGESSSTWFLWGLISTNVSLHEGGGLLLQDTSIDLTNGIVADNLASSGGAIVGRGASSLALTYVSVSGNRACGDARGGIVADGANLRLMNSILAWNESEADGDNAVNLVVEGEGGAIDLSYSCFYDGFGAGVSWEESDVSESSLVLADAVPDKAAEVEATIPEGEGNLVADPRFRVKSQSEGLCTAGGSSGRSEDDYRLLKSSPAIDAGAPGSLDPDLSLPDMGAYGGPGAGSWDLDGDGSEQGWKPGEVSLSGDCDDLDPSVQTGSDCTKG